ncbi:hypothetical protein ACH0AC_06755 [Micrococcus luteus]|uniref:hypothetical protein n=1 Tax=Micrococcus luteus TaxID=1270 RepID=UPI0038795E03
MQKNTSTLSRRKVTAGIAWSVPAVAAVAAAPFAAASPSCVTTESTEPLKYPGSTDGGVVKLKHGYGFSVTVTNPTDGRLRLSAKNVLIDFEKKGAYTGAELMIFDKDPCLGGVQLNANSDLLILEPGDKRTFWFVVNNSGNSANEAGCIYATLGVALVKGSQPVANLCTEVEVDEACFTATPPSAIC